MRTFRFTFIAAALGALLLSTTSAEAGIVFNTLNQIEFRNRENVIDTTTAGSLEVGDRIAGVYLANSITANGNDQTPPSPEVTGVFDLTVAFIIDKKTGSVVTDPTTFTGEAFVLFKPTNQTGSEGALAGHKPGTAFTIYEGGPADVLATLNDGSKLAADVFAAASDGTFMGSFGFGLADGSTDDHADEIADWGKTGNGYWYAVAEYTSGVTEPTLDFFYGLEALDGPIATVGGGPNPLANADLPSSSQIPPGTSIGSNKGASASILFDFVGRGNQKLNSATANSAADKAKFALFSNDPAQVYPNPEPGSMLLALIGAGCAAPFVRRRRRKAEEQLAA